MDAVPRPVRKIDYLLRRADYVSWHRQQSNQQILRSQQGFSGVSSSCPRVCQGCIHYHGIAYGRSTRTLLICGYHPYGWRGDRCPDWYSR
jgi:hypothetical protein